jgi:hypothetical protein
VTTYRRMRRQARQARRSGLQPMMVLNTGERFPETAGVVLLRWAWRYRSELAPFGITGAIVCAAWWLHSARPHWWGFVLGISAVTACGLAAFGARAGLAPLIERLYASAVTLMAGAWISAATALNPFAPPLIQALAI